MKTGGLSGSRRGWLLGGLFVCLLLLDDTGFSLMTLLAILVHEGGHLLAARCMRIPWRGFSLDLTGARLEVSGRMISYFEEWLLCAAGPLTGLIFAALGACFWEATQYAVWFSCASLLLSLFNLLPVRGFDGGRMLECTLLPCFGDVITTRLMRFFSFFSLFVIWAFANYFLLRVGGGLSLLCFSVTLLVHFLKACEDGVDL